MKLLNRANDPDLQYRQRYQQFTNAASNADPEEMKTLFIIFIPEFIVYTKDNVAIAVDTRNQAQAALRKVQSRIALHGETRRYRKELARCQRFIVHVDSLFERIRLQVTHWDKVLEAFNVTLPEVAGIGEANTADSRLLDLFPQLEVNTKKYEKESCC
jgi:hypothetical protein